MYLLRRIIRSHRIALALAVVLPLAGSGAEDVGTARRWAPAGLSSAQYESSPSFSADGREVFFMRSSTRFTGWRIVRSQRVGGRWSTPEPMPFTRPLPIADADPALSSDGRRLFFVSNRRPDGHGAAETLDIWYVERLGAGDWGEPQRMPEPVNSPGSELLPRPQLDGTLVFGSDRPGGHGQSDIYRARPDGRGGWMVENFGPPVSSPANEYEADLSADGQTLVAVIDRGDRSHLHEFRRLTDGGWKEIGRIPAREDVFQVGPLLSPRADRLLFAQADGERSGEFFVIDLTPNADRSWPPDDEAEFP